MADDWKNWLNATLTNNERNNAELLSLLKGGERKAQGNRKCMEDSTCTT